MSAEIFILSGIRAGERIVLDTTEFRVGSEANCEIFFDPRQDSAAKGRTALFRLLDDGWYVSCTGSGELLINQTVVSGISGRTRIRWATCCGCPMTGRLSASAYSPVRRPLPPRSADLIRTLQNFPPPSTVPAGASPSALPVPVPCRRSAATTVASTPARCRRPSRHPSRRLSSRTARRQGRIRPDPLDKCDWRWLGDGRAPGVCRGLRRGIRHDPAADSSNWNRQTLRSSSSAHKKFSDRLLRF